MPDPTTLTATAAAEAIRKNELSSEALVRACLQRIGAREDDVHAWAHLDAKLALAQAREADAALRAGEATGALHGVPVGVKDIFDTADMPTENGSPIFSRRRPERDATCVAALRDAGAVIMGKTATTELALLTPAKTRNPRNLAHTPGGSSAGSAAAVADHMIPAALGSQTAGSIVRPASFCGVYGFKPTLGLVPRAGVLMQSHTLDTVGLYARSIEDLALITDCMTAFEGGDATSFRRSRPGLLGKARSKPPMPPRLAFVKTPSWPDADAEMRAVFEAYADSLGESAVEIDIPVLADVIEWQRIVQLAENAHYYGPLLQQAPELISPGLTQRLEFWLRHRCAGISTCHHRPRAGLSRRRCRTQGLQRRPHACGARPSTKGAHLHGQPDHERAVDLSRHANRVAAAARSAGAAGGCPARRPAPRRRAAIAHSALAGGRDRHLNRQSCPEPGQTAGGHGAQGNGLASLAHAR